jgi:hypothetical protein
MHVHLNCTQVLSNNESKAHLAILALYYNRSYYQGYFKGSIKGYYVH